MPFTTLANYFTVVYTDEAGRTRRHVIELDGAVAAVDPFANRIHNISKSAVRTYTYANKQQDDAHTPDAGSEVGDTLRLFFRMADDSIYHRDFADPKDALFIAATGPDSLVVKPKATLDAAAPGTPENDLALLIDDLLAGQMLISDGETPAEYLNGRKII